jgi:hypothetical protein
MDKDQFTIEAWKQTIAVQIHFNDLELRIRAFGLTAIGAFLGLAGLDAVNANILVLIATIVIWPAFLLLDLLWYHPYLKAAVKHGEAIENIALEANDNKVLGLTKEISAASHIKVKFFNVDLFTLDSSKRMVAYYLIVWIALWVIVFASRTS